MKYVNVHGKTAHPTLESPDPKQCQAYPNMMNWSPFSLGPKPSPERCTNAPTCVVVQNVPGEDGKIGSMSLCNDCVALLSGRHYVHLNHLVPQ